LPSSPEAQRQFARALLIRGRADAAVDVLKAAVTLDTEDEQSLLELAILLADRRRFAEALELLDSTARRHPENDRTVTTLARMLAASPDQGLRNGARALDLAMQVYARTPSAVHGETVALALAELGRCAEAAEWIRESIGQAIQEGDSGEIERLRREAARYDGGSCRR
jgi:tetratricopeptide (TPR) repeat protein